MRINAKDEKTFKATALALNAAKQSVKTSKQHMTALSMGNEPDRQEEQSAYVDPTRFLDGKEIHKWNQLPQSLKKRYIAEGIKEAKASSKARSGILKDNYDFTEEIEKKVANVYTADLYRMEETAGINTYQRFEYNPLKRFQNHWNHREKNKKLSSENEIQGITDKRSSAAGQESIRKGERYLSKEQEQIKLQIKVGINKESATGKVVADSATATSTATSGAVTAGGSLVVTAGKKAADKFKDYMQERSMASEQAIRNVESKMTEIKNANHEMDSLPSSLKYIGAAVGAVLLSVLAVVVQAVFSFLAVIIGVIIAILVPIIVVVTIISTLIGIIAYLSERIAVSNNALSNMNMLVIGGSGSYKTTSVLTPNILLAGMTNVILDIKGDLLRKHGNYLKAYGVTVKSFNLINPEESDRYNPMAYLEKETDVIRLITNMQASVKPPDAMKGDPFWDDGVALYLQAMFFHEWLTAKEENRKPTLNNILKLVNMESKHVGNEEDDKTELQVEMDRLADSHGDDYPPVRDYRKLKEGATETVRSIIIMVNAMLRLCETSALKRLFEDDDIDIPSLGLGIDGNPNKKTALFLVMPDNDQSFNFLISMFYTQLFDVLIRNADHKCNGSLPIHVRLWADEFYAGPKPTNTEVLMGTIRSRNMSIVPILQSIAQIKAVFPQDKWEVFLDNCAVMIYLGSGPAAFSTHEYISKLLGEMTIDTRNDGVTTGMHGNSSLNNQRAGRGLMTPGEVKRMDRKKCLIFMEGQYPIMDWKNLPFDTAVWKESKRLAGKTGYKHPVRVVYNPKTMTYRTIRNKQDFQVLDKKDVEFYKEAEKTDRSIKVCEINEEDFLYLNFDTNPTPTEEELIQMFEQSKKDTGLQEKAIEMEEQSTQDNISVVPNFGTEGVVEEKQEDEWDLSGTINQCIQRYAERLTEDQLNEILLGLENGLTEEEVKSYFTFPVEKMNQYRRAYQFMQ